MLQSTSIKPSEMCGMEPGDIYERAERVQVRRASAVRIVTNAARPQSVVAFKTRSSLDQPSPVRTHRTAQSLDFHTRHVSPTSPTSDQLATSFKSGASLITPTKDQPASPVSLGVLVEKSRPQSSETTSLASSQDSRSSLFKKKRDAVLQFLAIREPSGQAFEQYAKQQKLQKAYRSSPKQRSSNDGVDNRKDSMQDSPRQFEDVKATIRAPTARRRQQDRPTMSMFHDGPHEPKLTVGTLSSRPSSLAAQKPLASKWTPSSSSSEASFRDDAAPIMAAQPIGRTMHKRSATTTFLDMTTKRVDMHDDSASVESDFVHEFRRSPVAAYLAKEGQQSKPTETQARPHIDTSETGLSAEDGTTPRSVAGRSAIIYWSPDKEARASIAERSAEASEDENWPLPLAQARLSRPYATHMTEQFTEQEATRVASHSSTASQDTSSSTSTILSPTFSNDRAISTAESTPFASPEGEQRQISSLLKSSIQSDAASIAPSEISVQWKQSPKQRLGLGGVVRKAEALPWEAETPAPRPQKPVEQAPKRTQSNRFSSLMKWRRAALDDIYQNERHLMHAERQQQAA